MGLFCHMPYEDNVAPDQMAHDMRITLSADKSMRPDKLAESVTLRSDCVYTQADREIYCPNMAYYPACKELKNAPKLKRGRLNEIAEVSLREINRSQTEQRGRTSGNP